MPPPVPRYVPPELYIVSRGPRPPKHCPANYVNWVARSWTRVNVSRVSRMCVDSVRVRRGGCVEEQSHDGLVSVVRNRLSRTMHR